MVSIISLESSSVQHDVHSVNYCPIYFKTDDKAGDALGPVNQDRGLAMLTIYDIYVS